MGSLEQVDLTLCCAGVSVSLLFVPYFFMARKKRISKQLFTVIVTSFVIHLVALLVLGGYTVWTVTQEKEAEFEAPPAVEPEEEPKEVKIKFNKLQKQSKMPTPKIRVTNVSEMQLKAVDVDVPNVQVAPGVGSGYGEGIGDGAGGLLDLKATAVSFFGIRDKAERIGFVIDFSGSMKSPVEKGKNASKVKREVVLRNELVKAYSGISEQAIVATVCFAGPAWLPGEKEKDFLARYTWKERQWQSYKLKPNAKMPEVKWKRFTKDEQNKAIRHARKQALTGGTVWGNGFEQMFNSPEKPDVIFFLTDGATSEDDVNNTIKLIREHQKKVGKFKVHCIALGVPKAESGLRRIASIGRGKYRLVTKVEKDKRG